MTQNEIRKYLGDNTDVLVQIANSGDGSPEIAWGDTFIYVRDKSGEPKKMPFTTIVTKDYEGFDSDSNLNRPGLFRLNIEVGKGKFEELFGFCPKEMKENRSKFDFTASNKLFPHPLYGDYGWVSIISPEENSASIVKSLLGYSLARASGHATV